MRAGNDLNAALAITRARHGIEPEQADTIWRGAQGCREQWIAWGFFVTTQPETAPGSR